MKSLSSTISGTIDNPHIECIRVAHIELNDHDYYFCDRTFNTDAGYCKIGSIQYQPYIADWGDIQMGRMDYTNFQPDISQTTIAIDNTTLISGSIDRFSDLFINTNPQYATITISETYGTTGAADDLVDLFKGHIEDITSMNRQIVEVSCTGFELSINNKMTVRMLNEDLYATADPDDYGRGLPVIYGDTIYRSRCRALDAGQKTTIVYDIDDDDTSIAISDPTGWPSGAHTIQIDAEQISISSRSDTVLTVSSRGYGGTDAAAHQAGAPIAEIQTEYVYMVADHPVESFINSFVYVDDVRQDVADHDLYNGHSSEYTGYSGKAMVVFNTLPIYVKQTDYDIDDTIDVNDGISVGDNIDFTPDYQSREIYGTSGESNCYDGNEHTYYSGSGSSLRLIAGFSNTNYGAINKQWVWVLAENNGPSGNLYIRFNSTNIGTIDTSMAGVKGWYRFYDTTGSTSWSQGIQAYASSGCSYKIYEAYKEVEFEPDLSKSGSAYKSGSVTKTGTVTLTGNSAADTVIGQVVTVDTKGRKDDGSGTITGTPNAILDHLVYQYKDILSNYCGLTSSYWSDASYAAALSAFANAKPSFVLWESPKVMNLMAEMARQCRVSQYWEAGVHKVRYLADSPSTDKTIVAERIDLNSIELSYTPRSDVRNKYNAMYARWWDDSKVTEEEVYREGYEDSNATSISKYGQIEDDKQILYMATTSTLTEGTMNFREDCLKDVRLIIRFVGGPWLTDLERSDVIDFSFTDGDELDDALLNLIVSETTQFRIYDMIRYPNGNIQIEAVEIPS